MKYSIVDNLDFLILNKPYLSVYYESGMSAAEEFLHRLEALFRYMMGDFDKDFQHTGNEPIKRIINQISPHIEKRVNDPGPKIVQLKVERKGSWDLESIEKYYTYLLQFVEAILEGKIVSKKIPVREDEDTRKRPD